MKRSKGFTLIELLAVIVILAIIALIATPMVLKYIENAKEGSNDVSVESILRAGEDYYVAAQLNGGIVEFEDFDLGNSSDMKKLGLKGNLPQGILRINSDGTTYLQAYYKDGSEYTKLENETNVTKNKIILGDYNTWTIKNGVIRYNNNTAEQQAEAQLQVFYIYIEAAVTYATADRSTSDGDLDFSKSLVENVDLAEKNGYISRSGLPLELNKEIDVILTIFDTEEQIDSPKLEEIASKNLDKIPHAINLVGILDSSGDVYTSTAYQLILNEIGYSNTVVVPNYVKKEDGSLEKVTTIDDNSFRSMADISEAFNCYIAPKSPSGTGKDVIITSGIQTIGNGAFAYCLLNSVILPNTVKTIGVNAFTANKLSTVMLPSSLEFIDKYAFNYNSLIGEIIIPKNVTSIGSGSFESDYLPMCENQTNADFTKLCKAMDGVKNNITNVTFEKESKIDKIDSSAFAGNSLTKVIIPGSITSIGVKAFNCPTLTSVIIQRENNSNLSIGNDAFGSVTPIYQS